MTRYASALLAVAAAAAVTGCGSSSNSSGRTVAAPTKAAATTPAPTPGGAIDSITWALPFGEPTTLDPVKTGDYSPATVVMNVCESLMRLNADYSITPGLAESMREVGKDKIVYTLRRGVRFSSGKTMTAEDAAASLKRNLDPKSQAVNPDFFTSVKSIEATGPLEVTVSFREPDELFNKAMAVVMGAVSDKDALTAAGKDYGTPRHPPVCTGPYTVASWDAGSSITLRARDDYWDPRLQPQVKTVDFRFISDSSTLTNALLSGAVDGTYEAPATSLSTLRAATDGRLFLGPSTQIMSLAAANPESPMAKPELTKALGMAIDRQALIRNVYQGAGAPNRAIVPPAAFGQGAARAVYQRGYDALPDNATPDVEAAKKLVEEVGAPSKTMTIALPAGDQSELQVATFAQAAAKSIGLNFDIKQMPPTEFSALFYEEGKRADVDLVVTAGYLEIPDPLSYAEIIVPRGATFNWVNRSNPEVDALLDRSRMSLDPVASAQSFVDAQAIYERTLTLVPLLSPYERLFMNKRITGAPASFAYINMPWAAMIGAARP